MYATIKRLSPLPLLLPFRYFGIHGPKPEGGEREDDVSLFICNVVAAAKRKEKGDPPSEEQIARHRSTFCFWGTDTETEIGGA